MKQALEDKDNALAGAQKVAREKTEAAEEKLAKKRKMHLRRLMLKSSRRNRMSGPRRLKIRRVLLSRRIQP